MGKKGEKEGGVEQERVGNENGSSDKRGREGEREVAED